MIFDCDIWVIFIDIGVYVYVEFVWLLLGIGNNGFWYFYLEIEWLLVEVNIYKIFELCYKIIGKSYRIR